MTPSIEYASFLIRVWREEPLLWPLPLEGGGREAFEWQGEVEHIQSGRCWTFGSLDEVLAFLRLLAENLDALPPPPGE